MPKEPMMNRLKSHIFLVFLIILAILGVVLFEIMMAFNRQWHGEVVTGKSGIVPLSILYVIGSCVLLSIPTIVYYWFFSRESEKK